MIIIACYTASALALRDLQEKKNIYEIRLLFRDRKILGVIRPVAEEAAKLNKSGKIGVTGTARLSNQNHLRRNYCTKTEFKNYDSHALLSCAFNRGTLAQKPEALMILKIFTSVKNHNIDTLLLGCTHYPLMITDFKRIMGKRVKSA